MNTTEKIKLKIVHFLRWTQRYTKTDMLYLSKGGFWLSLGQGLQVITGMILAVALANLIPAEQLGRYQFILSVASILTVFTLSGINTALIKTVAQGKHDILSQTFLIKLRWNTGILLAGLVVAGYYYLEGNLEFAAVFLLISFISPLLEAFNLYQPYLLGRHKFQESVFLGMWRRPLPVLALLVAMYFTDEATVLVVTYLGAQMLSAGLVYAAVLRRYPSKEAVDMNMVSYSKHLSIMKLVGRISDHADKILIFNLLGGVPLAIYTIALVPVKYGRDAIGNFQSLVLPKLSSRNYTVLQKTLPRKIFLFFILTVVMTVFYISIAPLLFTTLFPAYSESLLVSQVLALTVLFIPKGLYLQALTAHERTKELYIIKTIIPISKIILLLILLPMYGLWGAVASILIVEVIYVILVVTFFHSNNQRVKSIDRNIPLSKK